MGQGRALSSGYSDPETPEYSGGGGERSERGWGKAALSLLATRSPVLRSSFATSISTRKTLRATRLIILGSGISSGNPENKTRLGKKI